MKASQSRKLQNPTRAAANRSETTSMLPVVQAADTSAAARRLNQASVRERLQRNHYGGRPRRRTETQHIDFRAVKFWTLSIFVCVLGWFGEHVWMVSACGGRAVRVFAAPCRHTQSHLVEISRATMGQKTSGGSVTAVSHNLTSRVNLNPPEMV